MNILIFGASGPLGRQVTSQALSAGHQVTAFVRTSGRLDPHPGLREMTGDVLDHDAVAAAIAGHDAVISALGQASRSPQDLYPGTAHIIEAMKAAGVTRLIWISSHGVGDSRGRSGFLFEQVFVPLRLRAEFADKRAPGGPGIGQRPGLDDRPPGQADQRPGHRPTAGGPAPADQRPQLGQPRRRRQLRPDRTGIRRPHPQRPDHSGPLIGGEAGTGTVGMMER
jgi:hypothetical protein